AGSRCAHQSSHHYQLCDNRCLGRLGRCGSVQPVRYQKLLAAPTFMRDGLIEHIDREIEHAQQGNISAIIVKVNSLQDRDFIEALYRASAAGVRIQLIVRGICSIRPGRKGLSENIEVRSIVGDLLEHSRLFYFHNNGDPQIYTGSADAMARSFIRRVESLFLIEDEVCKLESMNVFLYNLKDNKNSYQMQEDGSYQKLEADDETTFDLHREFYKVTRESLENVEAELRKYVFGETEEHDLPALEYKEVASERTLSEERSTTGDAM
ncbi:MAG: phospholipase D-like domain-containing protein, partial [Bacteroidota bacterium]